MHKRVLLLRQKKNFVLCVTIWEVGFLVQSPPIMIFLTSMISPMSIEKSRNRPKIL